MPSPAPGIQIAGIQKRFGSVDVLSQIDWFIAAGKCTGLIGNSGSGKTTLLRIIARLEEPGAGSIEFLRGAGDLAKSPRPTIGMVFQNLGLWPHLTARQHVTCVYDAAKSLDPTPEALLDEVHLPRSAWDRRPNQLSGGEGQRVALARALACSPQLLLLDEPLAHLDAVLRAELLGQVADLVRRRGLTAIYVTHAWSEAAAVCDRIAVLEQGHVQQEGSPEELFWRPVNNAVARLTGPLITLPLAWLRESKISADPQLPVWSGLPGNGDDQLCLRPQQLKAIAATGANCWRVADCRPSHAGWRIKLEQESNKIEIPMAAALGHGEMIGIQICPGPT
jgi:ABC-type Fe3+/spermidine/putrescine transport system ATPase subunit